KFADSFKCLSEVQTKYNAAQLNAQAKLFCVKKIIQENLEVNLSINEGFLKDDPDYYFKNKKTIKESSAYGLKSEYALYRKKLENISVTIEGDFDYLVEIFSGHIKKVIGLSEENINKLASD